MSIEEAPQKRPEQRPCQEALDTAKAIQDFCELMAEGCEEGGKTAHAQAFWIARNYIQDAFLEDWTSGYSTQSDIPREDPPAFMAEEA